MIDEKRARIEQRRQAASQSTSTVLYTARRNITTRFHSNLLEQQLPIARIDEHAADERIEGLVQLLSRPEPHEKRDGEKVNLRYRIKR